MTESSPLMRSRRFAPLFFTQWGGAFNDNFLKSAMLIIFTYGGLELGDLTVDVVNNLVSATLIIPFLLFAAFASQYADKFEKSKIIRALKLIELIIMLGAAAALWLGSAPLLLLALFASGTQSACFSPLKYAILPQHVSSNELVSANGLLHMGTTMAIFMGLIAGSIAAVVPNSSAVTSIGLIVVAVFGYISSRSIPLAPSVDSELPLLRNPLKQYWRSFSYACKSRFLLWTIIAISWFWFLGSIYLTQLPNFVATQLSAGKGVLSFFLMLFFLGVCTGSIAAKKLSRGLLEPGLVPVGAVLITLVGFELYWAGEYYRDNIVATSAPLLVTEYFQQLGAHRVLFAYFLLGAVSALFIVPLSALLQARTQSESRAQVVGANNFANAIFMIMAAVMGAYFLGELKYSIDELFVAVAWANLVFLLLLVLAVPEFFQRFKIRFFAH